jgi:hypothetical protein
MASPKRSQYKGRKPTARAKAGEGVVLFQQQKSVSEIAASLGIGRGQSTERLRLACWPTAAGLARMARATLARSGQDSSLEPQVAR